MVETGKLITLQCLTKEDIEDFEFIDETPGNGMAYYDSGLDVAAINYRFKTVIFYDRILSHGKYAASFENSIITNETGW